MDNQPILLLAHSGFLIRNYLLGKFADEIIKDRHLIVAVQNPDDENLKAVVQGKPITLIPFPENEDPKTRHRFSYNFILYYMKRGENFAKNQHIEKRLNQRKHSLFATIVIEILEHAGRILKSLGFMHELEKAYFDLYADLEATKKWEEILNHWKPSFLFSSALTLSNQGYESTDLSPVLAAKKLGIPTGTLIQSWDNLTVKSAIIPDWFEMYWSWSDSMTNMLRNRYGRISPQKISTIGSPQFDFHLDSEILDSRDVYFGKLGLDPKRKMILIGSGTSKRLPGEHKTIVDFIQTLHQEFPECQVVLRPHPKDDLSRWEPYLKELDRMKVIRQTTAPPRHMDLGGFIPSKEFYYDQVNILKHADIVMNSSSTLTVDAAILDRPIICFGYDVEPTKDVPEGHARLCTESTHYQPLVKTGGVKMAYCKKDAMDYVRLYLRQPDLHDYGRKKIVSLVTNEVDGKAGVRLAREILNIVEKKHAVS